MHRRIKSELATNSGKRYSWGYGACPDLDDHAVVFKLLPAKEALGMDLTDSMQLLPEQSTAAVIIHHPEAKYYAVRGVAGDGVDESSVPPRELGRTTENGNNAVSLADARADP
jgi:hypothetical protein